MCQGVRTKQSKLFNITEVGYGNGLGKIDLKKIALKVQNESHYFRLRTQFGYFIDNNFSVGLGIGLDGYHNYTFNTAPLFVDVRYYFNSQPQTFFIFSNLGYALPLANNFEQGLMGGISIGRKMSSRKLLLLPSIGVNIQQLKDVGYDLYTLSNDHGNIKLMSLQLNLGLMF